MSIFESLRSAARPPLARWMGGHAASVEGIIGRVRPFVSTRATFASDAMGLEEAIAWTVDAAKTLVANTHFVAGTGVMEDDSEGASGSTYVPLKNYAQIGKSASLQIHLAAIETLRPHTRRQLDREEWQAAYNALNAAGDATGLGKVPEGKIARVYNATKSPDSFKDGAYDFDAKRGVDKAIHVQFVRRQGAGTVFAILKAANLPRGAYALEKDRYGQPTWWLFVSPEHLEAVATAVAPTHPLMAAALLQNAPVWREHLGLSAAPAASSAAPARPADVFTADKGNVGGTMWFAARDGSGILFWPHRKLGEWLRPDRKQGLEYVEPRDRAKKPFWSLKFWGMDKFIELVQPREPALCDAWAQVYADKLNRPPPEYGSRPPGTVDCGLLQAMAHAGSVAEIADPTARAFAADVAADLTRAFPAGRVPFDFQYVGVAYAKASGYRCMIGDQPGLGKTLQALGCIAIDPEALLPAVVLCPSSLIYNWQKEVGTWTPGVPTWPITSRTSPLPPRGWRGIVITSWSLLVDHVLALKEWGVRFIIADESQKAKSWDTGWSEALRILAASAPHLLELTGTPEKNRVLELWHQLHLLNPKTFAKMEEFGTRFTHVTEQRIPGGRIVKKYDGSKNEEALRHMLACWMVRRLKSDVLTQLPAKTRTVVPVAISEEYDREYQKIAADFEKWLAGEMALKVAELIESGEITVKDVEAGAKIVRQKLLTSLKAKAIVRMGALRRLLGIAKVPAALEWIETKVEDEGEPVVVFAEHKEVIDALAKGLKKAGLRYAVVDGRTPIKAREEAKVDFQAGRIDVFVGSQAAKEGITLTRAANTLFLERWWTPGDEEQAEDRIHRISQERPVTIWYMQVPETFDEAMAVMIATKRHVLARTVGESTVLEGEPNNATLGALLERFVPRTNPGRRRLPPPRRPPAARRAR